MYTYTDTCMGVEIMFMDEYDSLTDQNIKRVCDYLIERDDIDKDKEGKSISGMWKFIVEEAKKKAVSGCAVLSDDDVYGLAVHYFDEDSIIEKPEPPKKKKEAKKESKKEESKVNSTWEQISLF